MCPQVANIYAILRVVADREGFEPSVILRLRILSRDVVSANSPTCPSFQKTKSADSNAKNFNESLRAAHTAPRPYGLVKFSRF